MPEPILDMLQEVINADKRRRIALAGRQWSHEVARNRRLKRWARAIERADAFRQRNGGGHLKDTDHR